MTASRRCSRGGHVDEHDADADEIGATTRADEHAEPGGIDHLEVGDVDPQVADAVVDGFVEQAPDLSAGADIESFGDDDDT